MRAKPHRRLLAGRTASLVLALLSLALGLPAVSSGQDGGVRQSGRAVGTDGTAGEMVPSGKWISERDRFDGPQIGPADAFDKSTSPQFEFGKPMQIYYETRSGSSEAWLWGVSESGYWFVEPFDATQPLESPDREPLEVITEADLRGWESKDGQYRWRPSQMDWDDFAEQTLETERFRTAFDVTDVLAEQEAAATQAAMGEISRDQPEEITRENSSHVVPPVVAEQRRQQRRTPAPQQPVSQPAAAAPPPATPPIYRWLLGGAIVAVVLLILRK